jgi:hypothetical protein
LPKVVALSKANTATASFWHDERLDVGKRNLRERLDAVREDRCCITYVAYIHSWVGWAC